METLTVTQRARLVELLESEIQRVREADGSADLLRDDKALLKVVRKLPIDDAPTEAVLAGVREAEGETDETPDYLSREGHHHGC